MSSGERGIAKAALRGLTLGAAMLLSPFFASAQYIGDMTPEQSRMLDEVKRRMEPTPYTPANAPGCARWKGRAFVAAPGAVGACSNGCRLAEVSHGRYEVTGEVCGASTPRTTSAPAPRRPGAPVSMVVDGPTRPQDGSGSMQAGQGRAPDVLRSWRCVRVADPVSGVREVCGESAQ